MTQNWRPLVLRFGALFLAALCSPSCALTGKGAPLAPRYFSPVNEEAATESRPSATRWELRLGQLDSSSHLEERIAYRLSETELGYYEDRRWTEPPEQFLRRELFVELFDRRGLRRVVAGQAPMLDVELLSFEHLRYGQPRARVKLRFSIRDERGSVRESAIVEEQVLAPSTAKDDAQALAIAMSKALAQAVNKMAEQVVEQLSQEKDKDTPPAAPVANAL